MELYWRDMTGSAFFASGGVDVDNLPREIVVKEQA
jgi:hypothetical protein